MKGYGGSVNAYYKEKFKPICKGYILYGPIYMIFWKRQNYGERKMIGDCQGSAVGRDE